MKESTGSAPKILQSEIQIKDWLVRMPSVEEVRPGACPGCGTASRPLGKGLWLWGHGLRERQVRGPLEPAGTPVTVTVRVRRYLCRACGQTVQVGPRGLIPRRHYGASAIALSLCLYGVLLLPAKAVRDRISPWPVVGATAARTWVQLMRWVQAVQTGTLFATLRPCPPEFTRRQVAERAAMAAAAQAPPQAMHGAPPEAAFFGGAHLL